MNSKNSISRIEGFAKIPSLNSSTGSHTLNNIRPRVLSMGLNQHPVEAGGYPDRIFDADELDLSVINQDLIAH